MMDDGYENLRVAIVSLAVKDLKNAMRRSERMGRKCDRQKALERWFLSEWGQALSGGNGEEIIRRCDRTYTHAVAINGTIIVPKETRDAIYLEWRNGGSRKKIAEKYGVSLSMVANIITRRKK